MGSRKKVWRELIDSMARVGDEQPRTGIELATRIEDKFRRMRRFDLSDVC
jgi:hypothetical protein